MTEPISPVNVTSLTVPFWISGNLVKTTPCSRRAVFVRIHFRRLFHSDCEYGEICSPVASLPGILFGKRSKLGDFVEVCDVFQCLDGSHIRYLSHTE